MVVELELCMMEMEISEPELSGSPNFYEMKMKLLSERTDQSAIAMLDSLLALHQQTTEVNADVLFELKDLVVCIFETIGVVHLLENYQIKVLSAVNGSSPKVVAIIADYFNSHLEKISAMLSGSHIAVTIAFVRRIIHLDCADSIAEILAHFIHIKLVQDEILSQLNTNCSEIRFRIHNVTALALKRAEHLPSITVLVNMLAAELEFDDILTQLNAIEILADASSQRVQTADFLLSIGVVDRLYKLFNQSVNHPDSGFLYPAFMKFFGHLCVANIACISNYEKFSHSLFDMVCHFDRLDASLRLIAFDTFAAVCSTRQAKAVLSSGNPGGRYSLEQAMNSFGAAVSCGPTDLRVRHLEALTMLFKCDGQAQDRLFEQVTHKWFTWLGDPFPTILIAYLRKPFSDLRLAALRLVYQIEDYVWGVEILYKTPGFMECLLNRGLETTVEGKHFKFDVVCKLIDKGSSVVASEDMNNLKSYRKNGPFFVEAVPEIDMQND